MLSRESMIWFWDHYAPAPEARLHPDAAPLRNADLLRLPPAVVLTAEHDVLRDEGELYATRLLKAGVHVRHQRFAGQMHGFFTMVDILPGAAAAMDYVVAAIEEHLAAAPAGADSAPATEKVLD
jgi:acetyl esterase